MTDPTLQSRLDDALRDIETQRDELVRLREELRLERELRKDAEVYVALQRDELRKLNEELASRPPRPLQLPDYGSCLGDT